MVHSPIQDKPVQDGPHGTTLWGHAQNCRSTECRWRVSLTTPKNSSLAAYESVNEVLVKWMLAAYESINAGGLRPAAAASESSAERGGMQSAHHAGTCVLSPSSPLSPQDYIPSTVPSILYL